MKDIQSFPTLEQIKTNHIASDRIYRLGYQLLENDHCTLTMQDGQHYRFSIEDRFDDFIVDIKLKDESIKHSCTCGSMAICCVHAAAALLALHEEKQQRKIKYQRKEKHTPVKK